MSTTIAIDLGGTNIRAARIEGYEIKQKIAVKCKANGQKHDVIQQLFDLVRQLMTPETEKIGIGVPSIIDHEKGVVYDVQNIPSWDIVPIKALMEKEFSLPSAVDNDVNCFALGEKHFGIGKQYRNFVGITIGTGIGAGIVIDGKLYRGSNTGAGEIGCLPYLNSDYEHYCSCQWMNKRGLNALELSERAQRNDVEAISIWEEFGRHLGKLLQAILLTYDPEAIIIGGGITGGSDFFKTAMMQSMASNFPYPKEIEHIHVHFSTLEDCGLLGASRL